MDLRRQPLEGSDPARETFGELAQVVGQQALTLAFQNVFLIMASVFVIALAIVPFCKTVILSDAPPPPAH